MTKMNVELSVNFIPLPAEKRAAWDNSMRLLAEMLLEIYSEAESAAHQPGQTTAPRNETGIKTV